MIDFIPQDTSNSSENFTTVCQAYQNGSKINITPLNLTSAYFNGVLIDASPLNWTQLDLTNITCHNETDRDVPSHENDTNSQKELSTLEIAEAFFGSSIILVQPFSKLLINLKNYSEIDEEVEAGVSKIYAILSKVRSLESNVKSENGANQLFFAVNDLVANLNITLPRNISSTQIGNDRKLTNDKVFNTFYGSASFVASPLYNYISGQETMSKFHEGTRSFQLLYSLLYRYLNKSIPFSINDVTMTTDSGQQVFSSSPRINFIDKTSLKNGERMNLSTIGTANPSNTDYSTTSYGIAINESIVSSTNNVTLLPHLTDGTSKNTMIADSFDGSEAGNNTNHTNDSNCIGEGKVKDDALEYIFPITFAMLLFSLYVQTKLSIYANSLCHYFIKF